MRILIVLAALAALPHFVPGPAHSQTFVAPGQGQYQQGGTFHPPGMGPKTGELEVKAYSKIPKEKTAVQLTNDTSMNRNIRREVMVRLARRGNEVGFSGGNVMRLDISYFDLSGGGNSRTNQAAPTDSIPAIEGPGSNPRLNLPQNKIERRDGYAPPASGPTLRMGLTLYHVTTGKVLWAATASCVVGSNNAEQAGIQMVNAIFDDADKDHIADAGCPL